MQQADRVQGVDFNPNRLVEVVELELEVLWGPGDLRVWDKDPGRALHLVWGMTLV